MAVVVNPVLCLLLVWTVADMKEQTKVKEDMSEAEFHEKFEVIGK